MIQFLAYVWPYISFARFFNFRKVLQTRQKYSCIQMLLIFTTLHLLMLLFLFATGLREDAGKGAGLSAQPGVGAVVRRTMRAERQHLQHRTHRR